MTAFANLKSDRELIFAHFERLLERYPNSRVGQIIENATAGAHSLFHMSDAELERRLRVYLADSHIR